MDIDMEVMKMSSSGLYCWTTTVLKMSFIIVAMVACGCGCGVMGSSFDFEIHKVMSQYPAYSRFSKYLNQTQLASAINGKQSVTVLAVDNTAMGPLEGKSMDHIKNILSVHVALHYLDLELQDKQTIALTTLSHGVLLKINKGAVTFVSATHPDGVVRAKLIKPIVSQSHNNISVVQVNSLIIPPTNLNALIPIISPVPVINPIPVTAPVLTPVPAANIPSPVPVTAPVPVISPVPIVTPVPVVPPALPINPPAPVMAPIPVVSPVPAVPVPGSDAPADGGISTTPAPDEPKSGLVQFAVNWSLAIFLTFSSIYLTMLYH